MTIGRMKAWFCAVSLAVGGASAQAAPDAQALADDLVKRSDAVIEKLSEQAAGDGITDSFALQLIQQEMSPLLDFHRLTKRAMGKYWRKTDEETRERVVKSFRQLLENTYAKVLSRYSGQRAELVSYKPLPSGDISVVLGVSDGEKTTNMEYLYVENGEGDFLVGEVKIEGISLVANYRRQFAGLIKSGGADGLADKLQQMAAAKSK